MQGKVPRYALIVFAALMLIGSAAASDWEFNVPGHPYNVDMLSNDTNTIILTDLETHEGDHLHPGNLHQDVTDESDETQYVIYEYESLNGTVNETLSYHEGLEMWYAEFKPDYVGMDNVTFRARGETESGGLPDSDGEANESFSVTVGDIDVELLTDIPDPIRAESDQRLDVRTTNTTSGEVVDHPRPEVYFHNASESEPSYSLENFNDDPVTGYNFNAEVGMPKASNSTYIFRTIADEQDNYFGSYSQFLTTGPDIEGEVVEIYGGDNCDLSSLPGRCEVDTDLDVEFGITAAQAEAVNASIYGFNETGEVLFEEKEMDEIDPDDHNQLFDTTLSIPDINTSAYDEEIRIDFYAWEDDRSYSESYGIDLETYKIEDRSNPTAFKERTHKIRLRIGKYFSLSPYNVDRFDELNVNLTREDFEQNFTIDDFEYSDSSGLITTELVIPGDAEPGTYSLEIEAVNKFNESQEHSSSLTVSDLDASFESESEKTFEYNKTGLFSENITVENLVDEDKTVETTVEGLEDVISIPDSFTLTAGEEHEIEFDINYTEPEDLEGEIIFQDTDMDYNETTEIIIEGPSCAVWDSDLCLEASQIDLSVNSSAATEEFGVRNLDEEEIDVNFTLEGNVSDIVTIEDLSVQDYEKAIIEIEPSSSGLYEGTIVANTTNTEIDIPLTIETDLDEEPEQEYLGLDPSQLDFGTVPEGETHTDTVTVENLASSTIEDISVHSDTFNVEVEAFNLEAGETEEVELSIGEPDTGTIDFVGTVNGEEVTETLSIQGSTIEDYSQRTNEIQDRINDLRAEVDDPELDNELTEVSGMIDQINAYWDQGDYEMAQSQFESAQSTLNTVESQMGGDPANGTEPSDDGGLPILPIIGVFLVLMLAGGFVFYESYIPEEGDPLYGVLGE